MKALIPFVVSRSLRQGIALVFMLAPLQAEEIAEVVAEIPGPKVTNVYKNDFTRRIEIDQWTYTATPRTPAGGRIFKLAEQTEFVQTGLPEHQFIRLRLSLVVMGTQDGSDPENGNGPDQFTIVARGGTTILRTTFRNTPPTGVKPLQAYPDDEHPAALYPDGTGAKIKSGALGYQRGSLYEIEIAFPHRGKDLGLFFHYFSKRSENEEYYGINSMEVDVISGPRGATEDELAAFWEALAGEDPVAANKAMVELIACGEAAAEFVRKRANGSADEQREKRDERMERLAAEVAKVLPALDGDDFQQRVAARAKLKSLHHDALPLLEKELARAKSKEAKIALSSVVKAMRARVNVKAAGTQESLVQARVAKILRFADLAKSGRVITTSSGDWLPRECIDDGYFPTVEVNGAEVPRYQWAGGGRDEWVQYDFAEPRTFDFAEAFFVENKQWAAGPKLPESWSIVYLDGEEWKPVKAKGDYGITFGKGDRVEFAPVKTKSIRLKIVEREGKHSGLYEWRTGEKEKK